METNRLEFLLVNIADFMKVLSSKELDQRTKDLTIKLLSILEYELELISKNKPRIGSVSSQIEPLLKPIF